MALKEVVRSLIPHTTLGRCLLSFCQEKGMLFQSYSKIIELFGLEGTLKGCVVQPVISRDIFN